MSNFLKVAEVSAGFYIINCGILKKIELLSFAILKITVVWKKNVI